MKKNKKSPPPPGEEPQLVLGEIVTSEPPNPEDQQVSCALTEDDNWLVRYVEQMEENSRNRQDALPPAPRPNITTHLPSEVLRPNDNATRAITSHNIINKGGQKLDMGSRKGGVPIITTLSLTLNPNFVNQLVNSGYVSKEDAANYTHFDNSVMTAICSLWKENEKAEEENEEEKKNYQIVPLQTIYRFMAGFDNSYHPTPKQIQDVKESLSKMNMIQIKINLSNQLKSEKLPIPPDTVSRIEIQEALLSIKLISAFTVNGNEANVVKILSKPPLLDLAELIGEVIRLDKKVYFTPVNKSISVLSLQDFLISQITGVVCSDKDVPPIVEILFEEIFKYLPLPESGNKSTLKSFRSKIYDNTIRILSYWKEIEFIKDFSIEGKGRLKYYKLIITP